VIVPVLDEEAALPGLLDHLAETPGRFEHIVSDGGSRDSTVAIARAHRLRPKLVTRARGRAEQLNAGAEKAEGDVLVFVHADTRLPRNAYGALRLAHADPDVVGGNFALRFGGDDRFSRVLTAWYAQQRKLGIYYGDSVIWVRRETFRDLGGYTPLPIMDDYDFARRLERSGGTLCLPGPAITSARRWQQLGVPRTMLSWIVIRWLFLVGVPADRLARLYRKAR
jgi:rSAM/selenodomain-associated transferase 2